MIQITSISYPAISEKVFEKMLQGIAGRKRITTFYSDLSLAEVTDGWKGVLDTNRRVVKEWRDNKEYIAEYLISLAYKSYDFYNRENDILGLDSQEYAEKYWDLYEKTKDELYSYYDKNHMSEHAHFVWEYLD